jgi:NTE family protein
VENYPRKIEKLPDNLAEVYHRARDIMFSDKTQGQIRMSKVITRYLNTKMKRGAEIKSIIRITRNEPIPLFYENTDFSIETIRW